MLPRNKHVVHFSKNSYSLISKQIIVIVQSVTTLEKRNQSMFWLLTKVILTINDSKAI